MTFTAIECPEVPLWAMATFEPLCGQKLIFLHMLTELYVFLALEILFHDFHSDKRHTSAYFESLDGLAL